MLFNLMEVYQLIQIQVILQYYYSQDLRLIHKYLNIYLIKQIQA